MFKLNNELLEELGLGSLPAKEKNTMLKHIYDTLEQRVGIKLAEMMSNQQMLEFEQMMPLPTDSAEVMAQKEVSAKQWLESSFPGYKQVVGDEFEKLKGEIKLVAPQIVSASQES